MQHLYTNYLSACRHKRYLSSKCGPGCDTSPRTPRRPYLARTARHRGGATRDECCLPARKRRANQHGVLPTHALKSAGTRVGLGPVSRSAHMTDRPLPQLLQLSQLCPPTQTRDLSLLSEANQIFLRLCQFLLEDLFLLFGLDDLGGLCCDALLCRALNASASAIRLSTGGIAARCSARTEEWPSPQCRPVPDWQFRLGCERFSS